jgi:lipid-A-disaccharide synthase-like uncharacterized protein
MPEAFWWVGLVGDALLLTYAIHGLFEDGRLVLESMRLLWVAAFLFTPIPYLRNLVLIYRKKRLAAAEGESVSPASG